MLLLQDAGDKTEHKFVLSSIELKENFHVFNLTCPTYSGLSIDFPLQVPSQKLPTGYTVTVHLFKNPFHIQSQIIDLRLNDLQGGAGRIGYMFNLEALFSPGVLQLDFYRYCYAYYGVEYLFKQENFLQTKNAIIKAEQYKISDFFDDNTIILVLCNEFCQIIPNFNLDNYLANLLLSGFKLHSKNSPVEIDNVHPYLESKFKAFTVSDPPNPKGIYPLRLEKAKLPISTEAYVVHLFTNLLQKKFDQVTRFLMLYQVVEIFMPKMIHLEVRQRICNDLDSLTTEKIKDLVVGLTKHSELIIALLARHAIPSHTLTNLLRQEILGFFIHVNHPDYADHSKHPNLSLADLFYSFRNKIVHEYRILHQTGVEKAVTENKIDTINQLTEALISETITVYTG